MERDDQQMSVSLCVYRNSYPVCECSLSLAANGNHTVLGDVGLLNVLEHIVSQGTKHPCLFPVTECGFKGQLQRDL